MKFVSLLLSLVLASCGDISNHASDGGNNDNPPGPIQEVERNNSVKHPQYIGTFGAPDLFHLEGAINHPDDVDVYWMWTVQPQLTGISIQSSNHAVIEAFLYANDEDGTLTSIGHFMGDPGALYVTDWPTVPGDAGMYLILSTPSGIMCEYNVEMWAQ